MDKDERLWVGFNLQAELKAKKCTYQKRNPLKTHYNDCYQYIVSGDGDDFTVDIWVYPTKKSNNFFRVEFNPNKAGKTGMRNLFILLKKILGATTLRAIHGKATITRIDICCDSDDIENEFYPKLLRGTHSKVEKDDVGNITSMISGSKNSRVRLTVYDKNADAEAKGYEGRDSTWTRLELRLRLRCRMADLNMMRIAKEFSKFEFFDHQFLEDEYFTKKFRNRVSKRGLDSVFGKLNQRKRDRYRNRLRRDYQQDPWYIEDIESHGKVISSFLKQFELSKAYVRLLGN
jgi:hypothetical protein